MRRSKRLNCRLIGSIEYRRSFYGLISAVLPIETVLPFLLASSVLCLAPGPDNIFVLSQSITLGPKAGIAVALGLCTGLIVHTSAVAFGVAALLQASELAFTMLKFAGAAYLVYLAVLSFATASRKIAEGKQLLGWRLYRRGIVMNLANPKVSIFFLAFLPQFVDARLGRVYLQVFALGALFIVATIVVFGGIALLSGFLGNVLKRSPSVQVAMNRIAGVVYLALAAKLAGAQL